MMKNAFCFILKALFILEIFTFLSLFFADGEKWKERKLRVILKFMTSQIDKK